MKIAHFLYLVCLLFIWAETCSVIYRYDVWKHKETSRKTILFSDFHLPHRANAKQQAQLMHLISKKNGRLIVEDMYDAAGKKSLRSSLMPFRNDQFLWGLTALCRKLNIAVDNVEFRHESSNFSLAKTSDYMKRQDRIVEEIAAYDDRPVLNDYYEKVLKELDDKYSELDACLRIHEGSFFSYRLRSLLGLFPPYNLYSYSSLNILDLKVLHLLADDKKTPTCVCVGGLHADNINEVMPKLGYALVETKGKSTEVLLMEFTLLSRWKRKYKKWLSEPTKAVDFEHLLANSFKMRSTRIKLEGYSKKDMIWRALQLRSNIEHGPLRFVFAKAMRFACGFCVANCTISVVQSKLKGSK